MKDQISTVSIVVATVGRPSLSTCLATWIDQTHRPSEIIICADGPIAGSRVKSLLSDLSHDGVNIVVLENNSQLGATASYNRALASATCDFIALTSDDDPWICSKLENQLEAISDSLAIVLTGAFYKRRKRWITRPRIVLTQNHDPLIDILSRRTWPWTSSRYLPMSSIMFTKDLKHIQFDTELSSYEDYWWIHMAIKRGASILQLSQPLIMIDSDLARASERVADFSPNLVSRFNEIDPSLGNRFIRSHLTRPAIYSGNLGTLRRLRAASSGVDSQFIPDLFEAFWQYTFATMAKALKYLVRRET